MYSWLWIFRQLREPIRILCGRVNFSFYPFTITIIFAGSLSLLYVYCLLVDCRSVCFVCCVYYSSRKVNKKLFSLFLFLYLILTLHMYAYAVCRKAFTNIHTDTHAVCVCVCVCVYVCLFFFSGCLRRVLLIFIFYLYILCDVFFHLLFVPSVETSSVGILLHHSNLKIQTFSDTGSAVCEFAFISILH